MSYRDAIAKYEAKEPEEPKLSSFTLEENKAFKIIEDLLLDRGVSTLNIRLSTGKTTYFSVEVTGVRPTDRGDSYCGSLNDAVSCALYEAFENEEFSTEDEG